MQNLFSGSASQSSQEKFASSLGGCPESGAGIPAVEKSMEDSPGRYTFFLLIVYFYVSSFIFRARGTFLKNKQYRVEHFFVTIFYLVMLFNFLFCYSRDEIQVPDGSQLVIQQEPTGDSED